MPSPEWTTSQKRAWEYVLSGLERELTATSALKQYRGGGGKIRDSSWYSLYRQGFELEGKRERVEQIPMTYVVPDSMAQESWFDYQEKYVMVVKLYGTNPFTNERFSSFVTVESDRVLTKREWVNLARDAINNTPGSEPMIVDYLRSWSFFKRGF